MVMLLVFCHSQNQEKKEEEKKKKGHLYLDGPAGVKHDFLCEEDDQRRDSDQGVSTDLLDTRWVQSVTTFLLLEKKKKRNTDEEFDVGVAHLLDET